MTPPERQPTSRKIDQGTETSLKSRCAILETLLRDAQAREMALAEALLGYLGEQIGPPLRGQDAAKLEQIAGIDISDRARALLQSVVTVGTVRKVLLACDSKNHCDGCHRARSHTGIP